MVNISFIGILLVIVLLGLSAGWFLHRFVLSTKLSELEEKCALAENNLEVITKRCKDLETESMRLQFESDTVIKRLNGTSATLEKQYKKLKSNNSNLQHKNADIARKITQLYQAKQTEITKLHEKIELAKSRGEVAVSSKDEIQFLKQTVQRLEKLIMDESMSYEEHISALESRLSEIQPIDVLQAPTTIERDDLTEISGIGPKLQEFLHEFGIVSFHQLANMSDEELVRLSDELGDFGGRIIRDNWVEQARLLSRYKN